MLLSTVGQLIREHQLVGPGERLLVAFSGGPDSLCLLHVLSRLQEEMGFDLFAAHVDHGLRPSSQGEAQRAVQLGQTMGIEVTVLQAALAHRAGNLQESARVARHQLLFRQAQERGCHRIALGHTASDQAETVLMHAVRGAGVKGLGGMPLADQRTIRPLLTTTRKKIDHYLDQAGLTPVTDPTNAGDRYFRNRVRHLIIPALEQENPDVVQTLCRLAETCREEDDVLTTMARERFLFARHGAGLDLRLLEEPRFPGLRHRILRLAYAEATGSTRRLERKHVLALARLITSRAGSESIHLPGVVFERRYHRLFWSSSPKEARQLEEMKLPGPGLYHLSDGRSLYLGPRPPPSPAPGGASLGLHPERIHFPLSLRAVRAGDRLAIGPGQHRKIARILLDAKIPRAERGLVPLVAHGDEVIAVVGIRVAWGMTLSLEQDALLLVLSV